MSFGNTKTRELATARLGPLLFKYSWPALVAMSLNALYAVVDRFYIGRGCGEDAMAGLTLTFPVMLLLGAFGVFVGAGHSAVLSIRLGEGNRVACEKLLGQLVAFKLLFFFVLPPVIFFNADTVLGWCGGANVTPGAFAAAKSYLRLVVFSHLFSHLAFGFSAMMRAEGNAVNSMVCMIVGFGSNMILDPLLIFGIDLPSLGLKITPMGIDGAAWATNLAMFLSFAWAARYYLSGRSAVRFRFRRIGFHAGMIAKPVGIGLSPFLQQLMSAVINLSLAAAFGYWAADPASATKQIASLGVFQSVLILIIMPILGTQQGLQPIFGYNYGSGQTDRVKKTLKLTLLIAECVLITAFIIFQTMPMTVISIFGSESDLYNAFAVMCMKRFLLLCCINGFQLVSGIFFQAIGKPIYSAVLSLSRQVIFLIPAMIIYPIFMGVEGILWAGPTADLMALILSTTLLIKNYRKL